MKANICSPVIVLLTTVLLGGARADEACGEKCGGDLACEKRVMACHRDLGQGREAIERLKKITAEYPDRRDLARLLAAAYLAEGNSFWAQKTLERVLEEEPGDCDSRAWSIWIHLQQGELDLAQEKLDEPVCPRSSAERGRWALLRLMSARARQDDAAAELAFSELSGAEQLYAEDASAWQRLRLLMDPGWMEPVHLRAEFALGATSNASAGLPTTQAGTKLASPLMRMELFGRFVWPVSSLFKPAFELGLKGHYLDDFDYADADDVRLGNYLDLSLRPGLFIGSGAWKGFVGYRMDLFVMNQGDIYEPAPLAFYEAHRADLELETPGGLTFFLGTGRRLFREMSRSRWEVDGGLGWGVSPMDGMHLLLAMSMRTYMADLAEYDQSGATFLAVSRWRLPWEMNVRLGLTAGLDYYPNSPADEGGRDWLIKPGVQLWSPAWHGVRLGAVYEYTWRDSTALVSYSYDEHRGLLKMSARFDFNPFAPATEHGTERVELPVTGRKAGGGLDEERIQDLLRQDETARRGSSCVN